MKLAIPVSKHDRHLIPNFIKCIEKNTPGSDHDVLIVGTRENEDIVLDFESKIKHLFDSSETCIFDDVMLASPMSCNYYFQQTCAHLRKDRNTDAFMWCELDSVPLKDKWLDLISTEYYADTTKAVKEKRKPKIYLGVKERAYEGRDGELIPESITGSRMAQVGVYSAKICHVPVLNSMSMKDRHWTHIIQWYVVNDLNDSALIQNNCKTENYRYSDGNIVCDSVSTSTWDIHWNNPVKEDAVIIHGCKDESLVKLLLNNFNNEDMKLAKNLTIEEAEDVAEDIDDDIDSKEQAGKKIKNYRKRKSSNKNNLKDEDQ